MNRKNKLNIAITAYSYPPDKDMGGITVYVTNLAEGLAKGGHNVHMIAHTNEGCEEFQEYTLNGVTVHKINEPKISRKFSLIKVFSYRWAVRKKILELHKKYHFDIVESQTWLFDGLLLALLPRPFPVVTRMHTPFIEQFLLSKAKIALRFRVVAWLEKMMVKWSDFLVTSTRYYAQRMVDAYNLKQNRVSVVPLGLELPDKSALNLSPENEFVEILYVGRLEHRKGIDYLLEAVPLVLEKRPDVRFTMIGKDLGHVYERNFRRKIDEKNNSRIKFLGYVSREELMRHYRNCRIFVAPSLSESFGLIFAEAMSWGKPVVACDVCAVGEVIENGKSGLLVPPEDGRAIADALIDLAQDKNKRERMGRRGREICEQKYSLDIMAKNMSNFYQLAISRKNCS